METELRKNDRFWHIFDFVCCVQLIMLDEDFLDSLKQKRGSLTGGRTHNSGRAIFGKILNYF